MADPLQQRMEAARRQEQSLTKELARLGAERDILNDLKPYLKAANDAYEVILHYQGGSAGVRLNETVC